MSIGNGTVSVAVDREGNLVVCAKNDRLSGSKGLWMGDNPFDFMLPITIFQMALCLLVSRLVYFLLRPIGTNKFICSVLGGILLGPSGLGRIEIFKLTLFPPRQAELLVVLSTLGTLYSLFIIAIKMDIVTTLRGAKKTWRFGLLPFLSAFWVLAILLCLHHSDFFPSMSIRSNRIMFGIRYSLSSFPVIHDALVELNLITSELGQIALSSSMLNDGLQWVTLAILSVKTSNKDSLSVMFFTCYIGLILLCIFVIRPAFMKLAAKTPPGKPVKEIYIVFILLLVLIMSVLADLIGVTSLQGPLLLGLVMPNGPPLGTALIERTEAIVSNFLLPFFHVYIGFHTDLSTITSWQSFAIIQSIIIASYAAKVVGCMVVARTYNIRVRHGIVLGLILNIKGIVDLMSLARMKKLKLLDGSAISQLVLSMVFMTAIITPLIRILYKPNTRLERSTHRGKTRTIQSTARHSEFCIVSCVHNEVNVHSTITLLESCNPTQASPICVYVIHLIEILGKSTPVLIRFDKTGRKSLSVNYPNTSHIMRAFENYSENSGGPVTVLPYIHVAPYKSMHESICNLCEDNSIPFLIVPFHENHQTQGTHLVSSIRDINLNFQAYAPCTVGILVERGQKLSLSPSEFSFNVGIFFIGGADDREALALGIRMAEREGVKLTLFHVILQQQNKKLNAEEGRKSACSREEAERLLDEGLIDEFKGMMIGNDDVVLLEIEVEDGVEAMDSIRKFEGDYDLVMVGKRHNIGLIRDDEMCSLIENAETLGMYGDMLASTEFCNGMASVLVLQCGGTRAGGKKKKDKAIDPGYSLVNVKFYGNSLL